MFTSHNASSINVRGNTLEFTHITPKDAGRYYCTAENVHGNVTKVAEVIVNRNEITDNLPSQQGRVQEVVEGETVSLYCSSPSEDPTRNNVSCEFMNFYFNNVGWDGNRNSGIIDEKRDAKIEIMEQNSSTWYGSFNFCFILSKVGSRAYSSRFSSIPQTNSIKTKRSRSSYL